MAGSTTHTKLTDETIDILQDLIRIDIDSAAGFREAAEAIDDPRCAELFRDLGRQRRAFGDELKTFVRWNDETPVDHGSIKGAVHRWWIDVKSRVKDGNTSTVLAEAERGEDAIKERYEEALRATVGSPAHDVIDRQYIAVKAGHDRVRDLRDAAKERE